MLDMRRREDAEGESRMIGSGRREGFLGWDGMLEEADEGFVDAAALEVAVPLERLFRDLRKISACLRTWEKSVGRMPRRTVLRSPMRRSPL